MGALTELLRAIASSSHGLFEGALRQVIAGAEARLRGQEEEGAIVKLQGGASQAGRPHRRQGRGVPRGEGRGELAALAVLDGEWKWCNWDNL